MWNELILEDLGKPKCAPMTGMSRSRLWGPGAGYEARLLFMSQFRTFVVPAGGWVGRGGGPALHWADGQCDACTRPRHPEAVGGPVPWLLLVSLSSPSPIPQGGAGGLLHLEVCPQHGCRASWGLPHRWQIW